MAREGVQTLAGFWIPDLGRCIEGACGQKARRIRIVRHWTSRTPGQCVDLARVAAKVLDEFVIAKIPDLGSAVIGARCQEIAGRVPFERIDFVCMALEVFDRRGLTVFANKDLTIRGTGSKRRIVLPVHIQHRCLMEVQLLLGFAGGGIPDNR